jgi:hypothetical protein
MQPGFELLLLGPRGADMIDQRRRNDHRPVAVGEDHVAREHRHAAAADRLLPAGKRET